jgi:uncharacterized protein (TIGR03086 family)
MDEAIKLHDRALEATTLIIANIDASQLDLPTPCAHFDVRALLNHLVAGNLRFTAITRGEPAIAVPATGDFVVDDALTPYRDSASAVSTAWHDPALLTKPMQLPIGELPGSVALGIHTVEALVHGWDLAKATGQPTELDPDLCDVAWANCKDIDDSLRGPGRPFGPPVTPPPAASDTTRLMAWLGRQS